MSRARLRPRLRARLRLRLRLRNATAVPAPPALLPLVLFSLLLAVLSAPPAVAQSEEAREAEIERTTFLPQVFYVGDRVEMRVAFRPAAGTAPRLPEETPSISWGTLHRMRLAAVSGGWELRVSFTPFRPGTQTLPPMQLGDVYLRGIDVPVPSILDENRSELAPLRDQLLLPATEALFVAAVAVLVLVPAAWFVFFRWGRRRFRDLITRYREALPYRRINRSLRQLANDMDGMNDRDFYIQLLFDFRSYLSRRMHTEAFSATTEELAVELDRYIPTEEDREAVLEVFKFGDRVKFASQRASTRARSDHLEAVMRVLRHVERKRDRRGGTRDEKTPAARGDHGGI
ncbi:MAG: hypothetical protein ACLFNX_05885 [Spirochaetaceae bacterium]